MKNEKMEIKKSIREQMADEINTAKMDVDEACVEIANTLKLIESMVLPIIWTDTRIIVSINTVKAKRVGTTGKRQTIIYDNVEYPTYASLCEHLELSHAGNSAHRVLDTNNIKYTIVDNSATNSDKPATDTAVDKL